MKQKELLAQLIGGWTGDVQSPAPVGITPSVASHDTQPHHHVKPPRQSAPTSATKDRGDDRYDLVTRYAATVVSLCLCLVGWCVGAYFTVQWFQTVIPAIGIYAWLLPMGMTALETGFWPKRASGLTSRLFWLGILAFDAYTTAAGILPSLPDTLMVVLAWVIAAVIGVLLAIVPEKAGRALVKENFNV